MLRPRCCVSSRQACPPAVRTGPAARGFLGAGRALARVGGLGLRRAGGGRRRRGRVCGTHPARAAFALSSLILLNTRDLKCVRALKALAEGRLVVRSGRLVIKTLGRRLRRREKSFKNAFSR